MKIAFIGQKGVPATVGGVEIHVERLALGLKKIGHEVFVYARPWYVKKKVKTYKGLKVIYKPSIKTKNLDTISHVFLATLHAMRQDYDIIHYHGVGPALMAWLPKIFKPNAKVIITFHSIDRHHMKWGLIARSALKLGERFAIKFAHETIAVSKVLQRYCKKKYNAEVIYIPNGVDVMKSAGSRTIKKKYGLKSNEYILFLSRLVRHKGAHYLIEAYRALKPDKKLVIAGGTVFTDNYVKRLKAMKKRDTNIVFVGAPDKGSQEWRELYSNAYLFVLPSESEGLPIVVLEAMSFGRCALVSDIPQNKEAISDGFGFVFKNKSVESLKRKLKYLLEEPNLVAKVGQASQKHVAVNYNWDDIVKATESVYGCVIRVKGQEKLHQCVKRVISKV